MTPKSGGWLDGFTQQLIALVTSHTTRVRELSKKNGGVGELKRVVSTIREFVGSQPALPHKEALLEAANVLEEKLAKRVAKEEKKKKEKEVQQLALQTDVQHEI